MTSDKKRIAKKRSVEEQRFVSSLQAAFVIHVGLIIFLAFMRPEVANVVPDRVVMEFEVEQAPEPVQTQVARGIPTGGTIKAKAKNRKKAPTRAQKMASDLDSLLEQADSPITKKAKKPRKFAKRSANAKGRMDSHAIKKSLNSGQHKQVFGRLDRMVENFKAGSKNYALSWDDVASGGKRSKALAGLSSKDLDRIRKELRKKSPDFRECYEKALLNDESLAGKVNFLFPVAGNGGVKNAKIKFEGKGSSTSQGILRKCLRVVTKGIRFPSAASGRTLSFRLRVRS